MRIVLQRLHDNGNDTVGVLFVGGSHPAYTLEDEGRNVKVHGEMRIPSGIYRLELRTEGRVHEAYKVKFPDLHQGTLHLLGVPGFDGILIHIGNNDGDTDGCILVGETAGGAQLPHRTIGESTKAYVRLYPKIVAAIKSPDGCQIEVRDPSWLQLGA